MKNKSILFTVTTDLNYDQRMQRICSALSDDGYKVKLIGRKQTNSKPLVDANFDQKRIKCFFQKGKFFYLEFNIRLFFYLLLHNSDIICGIDLDTILPSFLISKLKGKIFVYDAHEYFTESANLINRKFEQGLWKKIERFVVPEINHAYTVNKSIADLFKKQYNIDFGVIRNVPEYQKTTSIRTEKIILYQGALRGERGLPELVKAMKNIDCKLIMAGGGALLEELKQLSKDLKLEGKIEFTGQQTPSELTEITRKAYVGISPLEPIGFNHLYSLSNKFLEYIQLEIPQVAMNFEEYKRINSNNEVAILMDRVKADDFTKAINTLLSDTILYQKLKQGTQKAKEDLNWEKEKVVLVDFYNEIINQ